MDHSDIVIVGAGAVGSTLARGLAKVTGHCVTLIDANRFSQEPAEHPGFDARVIALAKRTEQALREWGVDLTAAQATPIKHILVSDQGYLGQTRLHAEDYQLASFGQVVSIQGLGQQLYPVPTDAVRLLEGTTVEQVEPQKERVVLTLQDGRQLSTGLLVIADGGRSPLAEQCGFKRRAKDYEQSALIANVKLSEPHHGWAHERFTKNGPLALLPFDFDEDSGRGGQGYSLVWTLSHEDAQAALEWSEAEFKNRLQQELGYRHGVVTSVSERYCYPLALQQTDDFVGHRMVVVGNSAQALHPIAGQGFNLGLRDVLDLVDVLSTATDVGAFETLLKYRRRREKDKTATIGLTDTLVTVFSNQLLPLVAARNVGLMAMEFCAPLSRKFVRQTMGFGPATQTINDE